LIAPSPKPIFRRIDLRAARGRRREATGDVIFVRYADEFIVGMQHESDARRFLDEMGVFQRGVPAPIGTLTA
jgi:hypothetical protein